MSGTKGTRTTGLSEESLGDRCLSKYIYLEAGWSLDHSIKIDISPEFSTIKKATCSCMLSIIRLSSKPIYLFNFA